MAMLFRFNGQDGRIVMRGAALLVAAGALAGCSSSASRFTTDIDGIFTASINNQRSIIEKPKNQPFPGDARKPVADEVDRNYTGSVARGAVETAPLQRSALPPVSTAALPPPERAAPPPRVASAPAVDRTTTGSTPGAIAPAEPRKQDVAALPKVTTTPSSDLPKADGPEVDGEGWSRAGGTQITVKQGETVFNLSRRFGVPATAIMRANGLKEASALAAGQKIVIPTYVYSNASRVSAPDANPDVADAKSSRGTKYEIDGDTAPLPSRAPDQKLAVLPATPKVRESAKGGEQPATTASNAKAGSATGTYVVQSGDSLFAIARKTGVRADAIKAANGLDGGLLQIGQKLTIPAGGAVVAEARPANVDPIVTGGAGPASKPTGPVRKIDLEKPTVAAYTPPVKPTKVIEQAVDEAGEDAPDATGIGRMRWPVRGRVISAYGGGRDGIDIAVPEGTPVKAAENGVVIYAGDGLKDFGNTVLVRHENGLVTVYGHTSEIIVSRGDKVARGQEIARSGMSGKADLPKLHFEVRKDSTPVDPGTFLQ